MHKIYFNAWQVVYLQRARVSKPKAKIRISERNIKSQRVSVEKMRVFSIPSEAEIQLG